MTNELQESLKIKNQKLHPRKYKNILWSCISDCLPHQWKYEIVFVDSDHLVLEKTHYTLGFQLVLRSMWKQSLRLSRCLSQLLFYEPTYGVMGWFALLTQKFFIKFLHYLSQSVQNQFDQENKKYVIVCDNVRIHTSREVERFIVNNELRLMTITPNSPSLNPLEK